MGRVQSIECDNKTLFKFSDYLFTMSTTLTRRKLLHVGSSAVTGVNLASLLRADQHPLRMGVPQADNCIIIFLNGGPSHLDMWDMKPEGPEDSRGQFKPIQSSLPGVQVCELLPNLSQVIDRCTLVRSMNHSVNDSHAAAVYVAMTGHDRGEQGGGFKPTDNPCPGAVATKFRPSLPDAIQHACLPYKTKEGASGPPQPGFWGGYLGQSFDPLWITQDPNADNFSIPEFTLQESVNNSRIAQRSKLLQHFNKNLARRKENVLLDNMTIFQQHAYDILTSSKVKSAFRIQEEPEKLREAYGRNIYGQSILLARRMIEAGTRVVTISWAPDANATWDTHHGNFRKLKNSLLPQFDAAFGTLMVDMEERGLIDRTLICVLGDFGRTPKINNHQAGRDHWNFCYSILLAGAGIKKGHVYGASDRQGAFPNDLPTTPGDILATMYKILGINHELELYDRFNRPQQIVKNGSVVDDLLA